MSRRARSSVPGLRRLGVGLLALAALAACTDEVGTSVRVRLVYQDTWPIETTTLTAGDQVRTIDLRHEILLLVPDALDGQVMSIDVAGTRGEESIAGGSAVALIRKGETVDAAIVLDRTPCGVFCVPGNKRCEGENALTECVRDPEGCLQWGQAQECPDTARICSSGVCDRNCRDECTAGEGRCEDPKHQIACANFDTDPCLDLGPSTACVGSDVCYSGRCAPACTYGAALSNTTIPQTPQTAKAFSPVVVIDGAGTAHALYSVETTYQLRYAQRPKGMAWTSWVNLPGASGENPSMVVDKQRNLHVAYGGASLVYGTRSASTGAWQWSAPIETAAGIARWSSIALDSKGLPHIIYSRAAPQVMRHAWLTAGGTWMAETADTDIGLGCDLVMDGDTLHVSSLSTINNAWYSTKVPGENWSSERIAYGRSTAARVEVGTSIAMDRAGTLHFVYSDLYSGDDDLLYRYKTSTGTSWTANPIDERLATNTGAYPDLTIDPFDNLHVAYRTTSTPPQLQYAFFPAGGTSWTLGPQPMLTSGFQPAIAVGPDAEVRIVSADATTVVETTRLCTP